MERNNTKYLRYHYLYQAKTEDTKDMIPLSTNKIAIDKKYKTKANSKIGNYRQFSWKQIKNRPEYIKNRLEQVFKSDKQKNYDTSPDNDERKIRKIKNLSFKTNFRLNRNKKQLETLSKKSIAEQEQTLNSERVNTSTIKQISPRKSQINNKIHLRLASITCSKPQIYSRNLQIEQSAKAMPVILKYQGERVLQVVCRYQVDQQETSVTKKRRHTLGLPKNKKCDKNILEPWENSEINDDISYDINQ